MAGRILDDEERHVPLHVDRLRDGFARTSFFRRLAAWWVLMIGATLVVAADHGPALRRLGVSRSRFVLTVLGLFRPVVTDDFFCAEQGPRDARVDDVGRVAVPRG